MEKAQLANISLEGVVCRGDKGRSPASVLVDTGASVSFVSRDLAARVATLKASDQSFRVALSDRSEIAVTEMVMLTIELGGKALTDAFYVVESLVYDVVLGLTTLRKYKMRIDLGSERISGSFAAAVVDDNSPPAPAGIVAALGLVSGASEDDCVAQGAVVGKLHQKRIEDVVDAGIVPDRNGCSKLLARERGWAVNFGCEYGLAVLQAFVSGRKPITPSMRNLFKKCDEMKAEMKTEKESPIDDAQQTINAQPWCRRSDISKIPQLISRPRFCARRSTSSLIPLAFAVFPCPQYFSSLLSLVATRSIEELFQDLPPKKNFRPAELADFFDVSTTLIYGLIHEGQIPAYKLGSHYRISRAGLVEAMRNGLTFAPEF